MTALTIVVIAPDFGFTDDWRDSIRETVPGAELYDEQEVKDTGSIDIALVYNPPAGKLSQYPNLKAIVTLSAGADQLLSDPSLPDVPIVRLADTGISDLMKEYIAYHTLRLHRNFKQYELLQQKSIWQWMPPTLPANKCKVTVMGMGRIGYPCAMALRNLGFDVTGWCRTPQVLKEIPCFSGPGALDELLAHTHILVCILPLTTETKGILSAPLFRKLPGGASIINVSRGGCLNETDLLGALNNGQVANAVLDVFETEPLPVSNPLWQHPNVTVTPHIAGDARALATAMEILQVASSLRNNQPLANTINVKLGY